MRFWQYASFTELDQLGEIARRAEALGFEGIAFADHLVTAAAQTDHYSYTDDGAVMWEAQTPWVDPLVQTAALAQITTRLKFLTAVYVLPMRDAFTAAKAVSTAACIANGRLVFGIGAGWESLEFDLVGRPFRKRGRHLDEQIAVMQKLWTGQMVEHHGEFYDFPRVQMVPAPPPVPICVGGESPAALRRAAQHDGWVGAAYPIEQIPLIVAELRRLRMEAGREMADFALMAGCRDPDDGKVRRMAEIGITDYLKDNWLHEGRAFRSTLEYKLADMERFAERHLHPRC